MQIERFTQADSRAVERPRCGRWFAVALIALGLAAGLTACGGSSDEPATPGVATVGAAGGTVSSGDGAQIVFPKGALRGDVTVRIAKDSTGAPPLPPAAVAAGAVYAITPHGGAFDELVEVSIPVERADIPGDGQLLLVTAEPGDSQWRVLSGAEYYDGKLRARVMRFSFFRTIRLVNQIMPTLVTKIDGANNISGANRISPLAKLPSDGVNTLLAELSFPTLFAQPGAAARGVAAPLPVATTCRPVDLGHGAVSVRFTRDRTQVFSPSIDHPAVMVPEPWPRYPGDGGALTFRSHGTTTGGTFPGLGAIHYYGNESPRISGLHDANPPSQAQIDAVAATQSRTYPPPLTLPVGNVYALPPAGDNAGDNLYTWHGTVYWSATQNGSVRIDAAIMTTCGLLLEAAPIAFKLDVPPATGYLLRMVVPALIDPSTDVAEGADVTMHFGVVEDRRPGSWSPDDTGITYRVDYSPDPTRIDWQPLPAAAFSRVQFQMWNNDYRVSALYLNVAGVHVTLPAVQQSQAGHYRVFWCDAPGCFNSEAVILAVRRAPPTITSQPPGQTVQAGQTASFTVATAGAPAPALQWQKRSLLAAAFGFAAWTNIEGATGTTYTTPSLALGDTATQYRVWATNAAGSVASDIAMLTVVERYLPPVIVAQPGNLNVTVGGTAVFAATVSGPGPLSYQWRRNGVNITGANSAILTLANVTALNDGRYDLVVTNSAGSTTTDPGLLQVTLGTPIPLAPVIAASPASITVAAGNAANFAVAVTGTGPYTYQWFKSGVTAPIAEGDFPSFGIAAVTAADAGAYSVRVTNNIGNVLSAAATLTVGPGSGALLAPTITTAPVALAVLPGGGATFAVAVAGTGPFTYQWRRNGADVAGATAAVLHIAAVGAFDGGQYAVEVRNAAGTASSGSAPLIVIGAPVITQQPAAVSASVGNAATLTVAASGDGLLYQWTRNQIAIPGATAASYTTPALTLADSGAVYGVIVYNGAGLVFSQGAVLTVLPVAPVAKAWGQAGQIEGDKEDIGDATRARVATDASGNSILVWQQADRARTNIWAKRYSATSQTWGVPTLIEADDAGNASGPQIAIVGNGDAIAVWYQDDGSSRFDIWANRYDAATNSWGTATLLEASTATARFPQIASDSSGNALAVWSQCAAGTCSVWANRYSTGTGWGTAARIESGSTNSAGGAQIAIDASGNALAVWNRFDGGSRNDIWANRYTAATNSWGTAVLIESGNAGTAEAPQVAIDANGNGVAAWAYFDGTRYDIMATHYTAATNTWGPAALSLTAAAGSGSGVQVAFDAAGNAIAVWTQQDGTHYDIWANRYTAGTGWGTAVLIESDNAGNADQPEIAFDEGGNALAVWHQSDGTRFNVWANRYTAGTGWGAATLLETDNVGDAVRPQIAIDGNGNGIAVWDQSSGVRIDIWGSLFR